MSMTDRHYYYPSVEQFLAIWCDAHDFPAYNFLTHFGQHGRLVELSIEQPRRDERAVISIVGEITPELQAWADALKENQS